MQELIVNLHMHTTYSDGSGSHADIARAALAAGVDVVIVTDHNVWVDGLEGYYQEQDRRVLLLVGEELHDRQRVPQKNHLLVFGAGREMSPYNNDPQRLIDQVHQANGLAFIAHPTDPPMPAFGEDDISWVDWNVKGYTGIELWNGFSELKDVAQNPIHAVFLAFNPHLIARGPIPATLRKWDELTAAGKRVVAIGGSDAHALKKSIGPIHRTIFPYQFHFRAINTHISIEYPLTGNLADDRRSIFHAFREGHAFIGYDLPAPTNGFRFTAQGKDQIVGMGDEITTRGGVTLQIHLPRRVECVLLKDGEKIKGWTNRDNCTHITSEPGVYRIEAYLNAFGMRRGWIFSNPIYLRK